MQLVTVKVTTTITVRVTRLPGLETSTHQPDNMNDKIWDRLNLEQGAYICVCRLQFEEMKKNAVESVTGYNERLKRHLHAAVGTFLSQFYYAGHGNHTVGELQQYGVGAD